MCIFDGKIFHNFILTVFVLSLQNHKSYRFAYAHVLDEFTTNLNWPQVGAEIFQPRIAKQHYDRFPFTCRLQQLDGGSHIRP